MKCSSKEFEASQFGNLLLAYDRRSAFTTGEFSSKFKEFLISVPGNDGYIQFSLKKYFIYILLKFSNIHLIICRRKLEFMVAVNFAVKKGNHLGQYLNGRQHDNPQETIQILGVVLRDTDLKG